MFNLDNAVADWRRQMAAGGINSSQTLDELESHLRENIRSLQAQGIDREQAFIASASKFGSAEVVSGEFHKMKSHSCAPVRIGSGVWMICLALLAAYLLTEVFAGKLNLLLFSQCLILTAGYGAALLVGALAVYHVTLLRFGKISGVTHRSVNQAIGMFTRLSALLVGLGLVLGMVWARGWHGTGREIGALCAFVWLVAMSRIQGSGRVSERIRISLNICGNIVIGLAWFGAGSMTYGLQMLGYSPLNFILGAHILFLLLALTPPHFRWMKRQP